MRNMRWLVLVCLCALALMMPCGALADTVNNVKYLDEKGNEQTRNNVTLVTTTTTQWTAGWYVVQNDVTLSGRSVKVTGDVHLILGDNATLKVGGGVLIDSTKNSRFTVYGQSTGNAMGTLDSSNQNQHPGIGAVPYSEQGDFSVTINGGNVIALGGNRAAGIGTGYQSFIPCSITINGGNVTANSGAGGAGIGSGEYSNGKHETTIKGGNVKTSTIRCQSATVNGDVWLIIDDGFKDCAKTLTKGVVVENTAGKVYGSPSLPAGASVSIPAGSTLELPKGSTLTIPTGSTLTNEGTLTNAGMLANNGIINNSGTLDTQNGDVTASSTSQYISNGGTILKVARTITRPGVATVRADAVTLQAATPSKGAGYGTVQYGQNTSDTSPSTWQTSLDFTGLTPGTLYYFYAQVTDGTYHAAATSDPVQVTTLMPPVITTTSLPDGMVSEPYNAELKAKGDPTITWGIKGSLPDGLTLVSKTGEITGTPTKPDKVSFTAVATNNAGSAEKDFTINISDTPPIVIDKQPSDQSVQVGQQATFSVSATGVELTYQWEVNDGSGWTPLPDATTERYTIAAAQLDSDGLQYRCLLGDAYRKTLLSNEVTLRVTLPPPPKTGDTAQPALWLLLTLLGAAGAALLLTRTRKQA